MPNRILREDWLSSERVNRLSALAEVCYVRLQFIVDDYGRHYATPNLFRARAFPHRIDKITNAKLEAWLKEIEDAGLADFYEVDGVRYLQVRDFRQQIRSPSKFPPPPGTRDAPVKHVRSKREADAHLGVVVVEGVSEGGGVGGATPPTHSDGRKAKPPAGWWRSDEGIQEAARVVGVKDRPGESFANLKARVERAIEAMP